MTLNFTSSISEESLAIDESGELAGAFSLKLEAKGFPKSSDLWSSITGGGETFC